MMKKYIIGALIGFVLSLGVGAHAEVKSMIGKIIDGSFPITIKGVTLQNPALTIEGVSYVPTREFAESLGAQVKFNADLGIEVVPPSTPVPDKAKEQRNKEIHEEITKIALELQKLAVTIAKEKGLYRDENGPTYNGKSTMDQSIIDALQKQIDEKNARIQELVKEREALLAQP